MEFTFSNKRWLTSTEIQSTQLNIEDNLKFQTKLKNVVLSVGVDVLYLLSDHHDGIKPIVSV